MPLPAVQPGLRDQPPVSVMGGGWRALIPAAKRHPVVRFRPALGAPVGDELLSGSTEERVAAVLLRILAPRKHSFLVAQWEGDADEGIDASAPACCSLGIGTVSFVPCAPSSCSTNRENPCAGGTQILPGRWATTSTRAASSSVAPPQSCNSFYKHPSWKHSRALHGPHRLRRPLDTHAASSPRLSPRVSEDHGAPAYRISW